METKEIVGRSGVVPTDKRRSVKKINRKRKKFNFRQGMIMKVILGPPRAKERMLNRSYLP